MTIVQGLFGLECFFILGLTISFVHQNHHQGIRGKK